MNIVVGVAGGIAAYKACHIVRRFKEDGHDVVVVPTENALKFVGSATFEALSGNPVASSVFDSVDEVRHVRVGQEADAVVIAPTTADVLARISSGMANDMLTSTVLVATCPLIVAPAMHTEMWLNAATQHNVSVLRERGITVIEPAHGRLTGKDTGPGRLPDPEQIVEIVYSRIEGVDFAHTLASKKIVISAGGTLEPIDPVRFIGNRSSGRQGFALAEVAAQRGAEVVIVAGNHEPLPTPAGARIVSVETTREMEQAVRAESTDADVVIMAAAVADFRPESVADSKLKKENNDAGLSTVELAENPDILAGLVNGRAAGVISKSTVLVGFAAETGDDEFSALDYASKKFERKGCDILMANEVGGGKAFGTTDNQGWILTKTGEPVVVEKGTKQIVAAQILDEVARHLQL